MEYFNIIMPIFTLLLGYALNAFSESRRRKHSRIEKQISSMKDLYFKLIPFYQQNALSLNEDLIKEKNMAGIENKISILKGIISRLEFNLQAMHSTSEEYVLITNDLKVREFNESFTKLNRNFKEILYNSKVRQEYVNCIVKYGELFEDNKVYIETKVRELLKIHNVTL